MTVKRRVPSYLCGASLGKRVSLYRTQCYRDHGTMATVQRTQGTTQYSTSQPGHHHTIHSHLFPLSGSVAVTRLPVNGADLVNGCLITVMHHVASCIEHLGAHPKKMDTSRKGIDSKEVDWEHWLRRSITVCMGAGCHGNVSFNSLHSGLFCYFQTMSCCTARGKGTLSDLMSTP